MDNSEFMESRELKYQQLDIQNTSKSENDINPKYKLYIRVLSILCGLIYITISLSLIASYILIFNSSDKGLKNIYPIYYVLMELILVICVIIFLISIVKGNDETFNVMFYRYGHLLFCGLLISYSILMITNIIYNYCEYFNLLKRIDTSIYHLSALCLAITFQIILYSDFKKSMNLDILSYLSLYIFISIIISYNGSNIILSITLPYIKDNLKRGELWAVFIINFFNCLQAIVSIFCLLFYNDVFYSLTYIIFLFILALFGISENAVGLYVTTFILISIILGIIINRFIKDRTRIFGYKLDNSLDIDII